MSTVEEWEAELEAFAPAVAPWVVNRPGGFAALAPWEKVLLGNMYINAGSFWNHRIGPFAYKRPASRPAGWAEALEALEEGTKP